MASRWVAVDKVLLLAVVTLVSLGLVMVYSASYPVSQSRWGTDLHFVARQAVAVGVGMAALVLAMFVDYRRYRRPAVVLTAVLASLASLVAVLLLPGRNGVHRWIALGPVNAQPSEAAKLALILFLAAYLARRDEQLDEVWSGLLPALALIAAVAFLVAIEPDLGTAVAIGAIGAVMLWVAGLSTRVLAQLSAAGAVLAALQVLRTGYQSRRILAYLDPWGHAGDAGYQTVQSLIAVGSGGLTGVGLAESSQKLFFLPYPYTDFIYAVIAEEFGLLGSLAVLSLFLLVLWRGARAAHRAPDRFGFYLGTGLTAALVLQALVNISIVLALLPTTGIPLPFVSYGGSSLVVSCAAVGILLNLSQHGHS